MCESFFATLECELLDRDTFRNRSEAILAIFDYRGLRTIAGAAGRSPGLTIYGPRKVGIPAVQATDVFHSPRSACKRRPV
jgi:hypothetical protein